MSFKRFFLTVIATIIVTRLWVWFTHTHSPKIFGFQLHHWMMGVAFILVYLLIRRYSFLFAIGLGLFIDETPLLLIYRSYRWPTNNWIEYFSWESFWIILLVLPLTMLGWYILKEIKYDYFRRFTKVRN